MMVFVSEVLVIVFVIMFDADKAVNVVTIFPRFFVKNFLDLCTSEMIWMMFNCGVIDNSFYCYSYAKILR